MTDHELEQGLRAWYRADVADEVAPPSLYASLSEITQASTPAWTLRRRAWVLLAAAVLLAVSAAVIASGLIRLPRVPDPRFTSPLVFTTSDGGALRAVDGAGADPRTIVDGTAHGIQVSPDGQYVLLEGTSGLTLSRTDGSSSRTFPDGAGAASWAPDSHAIAMVTGEREQMTLMIADVDGSEPRQIDVPARAEPQLAWSPDNVHVAYAGLEPGDFDACQAIARMLVVDTRSGVVSDVGPVYPATLPVWSNGGSLAVAVWREDVNAGPCNDNPSEALALTSVNAATGDVSTVMTADHFNSIAWSADDRSILTLVAPNSGGLEIVRAPTDGGAVERLARLTPNWPVSSFFERGAVWSPDGSHLAWTELDDGTTETYSLWVMGVADGQPRRIAERVLGYVTSVVQPLWSPDGAWLAFYREPSSSTTRYALPDVLRIGRGSIWIVRPDGSDERLAVDDSLGADVGRADW